MEFRVLGPLEVLTDEGKPVDVTGAKLRALLAMLVLHSGSVVRFDLLIDALWGDVPPQSANNALQVVNVRAVPRHPEISITKARSAIVGTFTS